MLNWYHELNSNPNALIKFRHFWQSDRNDHSINQSKFVVNSRPKSVLFRMSSILPGTATEAPLGDQLVICKCILSCWWKVQVEVVGLISSGKLFQVLGAEMRKVREAVAVLVIGTTSRTLSEECVDFVGTWSMMSFYIVWWCRRTLNVNEVTLYSMRCLTGNQCRARRSWVADERYGGWQTTRSRELCTRCSRVMLCWETPYRMALQ